jgi:hypothetical protein
MEVVMGLVVGCDSKSPTPWQRVERVEGATRLHGLLVHLPTPAANPSESKTLKKEKNKLGVG